MALLSILWALGSIFHEIQKYPLGQVFSTLDAYRITQKDLTTPHGQATTRIDYISISGGETQATQLIPKVDQSWEPLTSKVPGGGIQHKYHHLIFFLHRLTWVSTRHLDFKTNFTPFQSFMSLCHYTHWGKNVLQVKVRGYSNFFSSRLFLSYITLSTKIDWTPTIYQALRVTQEIKQTWYTLLEFISDRGHTQ